MQETPVHIHLWHRDFWLMLVASLLLTMSVYVLVPVVPHWLMQVENFTPAETGLSMGVFAAGLYLLGAHCSWLVQHYRRNVVCMWAAAAVAAIVGVLWYVDSLRSEFVDFWVILLERFALGAAFGLAQMVLSSTLIIDTCESDQRTRANYYAAWFARLALAGGPLAGVLVYARLGFAPTILMAAGCALASVVLIRLVNFPFRTPEDYLHVASLDRFFLPRSTVLFLQLLLVCVALGLVLSLPVGWPFYAWMLGGLMVALLARQTVFSEADQESEIMAGLILQAGALLALLSAAQSPVAPVLLGLAAGLVGSRFLLFFIKLSRHCQRGTALSSYFLAWETGLTIGIAAGYGVFCQKPAAVLLTAVLLTAASLVSYHFFTYPWFLRHKHR